MQRPGGGPPRVTAYIDESYRSTSGGRGEYLFAATLVADDLAGDVRNQLVRALPGRLRRFHWRVDSRPTRERAAACVAQLKLDHVVVYQVRIDRRRQERARQHAQWNLAVDLRERGVDALVFERREAAQDEKDRATLDAVRRSGAAGELQIGFARPHDEPLLWIPDIICGMVGTSHVDPARASWFASYLSRIAVQEVLLPAPRGV